MDDQQVRFDGRVAVVTGAGNGLGRGYALELAARGAAVVCNDIAAEAANAVVAEIVELGGTAVAETTSVAAPGAGEAIVAAAVEAFDSVDIVVNNAGQLLNAPFDEMSTEDFDAVIATHLGGSFHLTQAAYRHMKVAGYGRIVLTSSASILGLEWSANYAAAKGGIIGLCKVIALEGAPHGIKANAILPVALGTRAGSGGRPGYSRQGFEEMTRSMSPIAPHMAAERVAPFVAYLAHHRCEPTGRIFSVGCGHVAEVHLGRGLGWRAEDVQRPTAEAIAAHFGDVADLSDCTPLGSVHDEFALIARSIEAARPDP